MPRFLTDARLPDGLAAARWRSSLVPLDPGLTDASADPTITNAQTSTPTSGYIKHTPQGLAISGTDVVGGFSYRGATVAAMGTNGTETTYLLGNSRSPGTAGSQNVFAVEWCTDAPIMQIRHRHQQSGTTTAGYRLYVDDRAVSENCVLSPGTGLGNTNLLKLDFGTAKFRQIRFESYLMPFGGVYIPPAYSLWGAGPRGGRTMVLGDSITDGSNENTAAGAGTWFNRAMYRLGCTDGWEQGRGGTGYITPGSTATFVDRVGPDIVAYNPDRVIVWGGYNDNQGSQSAIAAAAATVYGAIRDGCPQAELYVIGCWNPTGGTASTILATDETLRAQAAAAKAPFLSPVTGNIYNHRGDLVAGHGPWMRPATQATYVGADNVHPNNTGHGYLARRIVQALMEVMPD